jgi:hypothetical protein
MTRKIEPPGKALGTAPRAAGGAGRVWLPHEEREAAVASLQANTLARPFRFTCQSRT